MANALELHIDTSATVDLHVNPACYPRQALPGDLIAVRPVLNPSSKGKAKDSPLLFKIEHNPADDPDPSSNAATATSAGANSGGAHFGGPTAGAGGGGGGGINVARRRAAAAVTVSPTLAAAFGWVKNRIEVQLTLIPSPAPPSLCASHIELYFNNLYLSRPDAFVLSLNLIGKVVHSNQRVSLPGSSARLRVGDMWSSSSRATTSASSSSRKKRTGSTHAIQGTSSHNLDSAVVTDSTRFIFRSESSRSYIFVEVSQEMWQFEEDGGTLAEKCEMFLDEVFAHYSGKMTKEAEDKRSKGIPTSHVVSVILYGRVVYDDKDDAEEERAPLCQAADGTLFRDFFKVILDLTPSPSASIVQKVASELRRWQELVLLRTREDGTEKLSGRLAYAHESPVLEATNLALNSFEEHWIDRDLHRTGLEVIVLTAGSSFYQVDKQLLRLTTERMLYHGIGLDLISLSKMPLHSVPLFQFSSPDPAAAESVRGENWEVVTEADMASVAGTTAGNGGGLPMSRRDGPPPTGAPTPSSKLESHFSVHAASSLHSANSPATRSSLSSRHPQLRHRPSLSSLRDPERPIHASSPLREVHQPLAPNRPQQPLPSTPQSTLTKPVSIHTGSGAGPVARGVVVPDDQRDPLYYDPVPTLAAHVGATQALDARRGSVSTAPFPASSTRASHSLVPASPSIQAGSSVSPPTRGPAPVPPIPAVSQYYSEPLFVFPHFFGTQPDKPHRVDRFMPRARCYELFSQGLGERMPLSLPLLKHDPAFGGITTDSRNVDDDLDEKGGYLDEYDKKLRRRELFDAVALGVQDLETEWNDEHRTAGGGEGGGIVIGRKGNWGPGRETGSGGEFGGGGESGVSAGVSVGGSFGDASATSGSAGASGGATGESSSFGSESDRSEGEGTHEDRHARGRSAPKRKESESEPDDGGGFGIGVPAVVLAAAKSEARHSESRHRRNGSISTTSSSRAGDVDPDRGRQASRRDQPGHAVPVPSNDSGGRSKTPVPKRRRPERSSSVAASIRTAHSTHSRLDAASTQGSAASRKVSTPALIARLTGAPAGPRVNPVDPPSAPASQSPPVSTVPLPRPSWLSLFSRTNSSASTATVTPSNAAPTAPQVAVARVDVQANISTEPAPSSVTESSVDSPVLSATSTSLRPSLSQGMRNQAEAEDAVAASGPAKPLPTQPITIGLKASQAPVDAGARAKGKEGGEGNGVKRSGEGQRPGQISGSLKVYEPGEAMRKGFERGGGRISVAARFNPSKPGKRSVGLADQARRWAGILVIESKNMRLGVKWRSITRGACLPITTDYLPSADALSSQYSEYRYAVPTNTVTSSFLLRPDHPKRSHILTLVTELICQRLSHGFQIFTPTASKHDPASSKTLPDVLRDIQDGETTAVYLSLSNQIHRIWYDRRSQSVFVKILRRRRTWAKPEYFYRPLIWTQGADRADVTPLTCPYPSMVDPVEWQHADRLVAGAESYESKVAVRYRSTRLVLLPSTKIPDRDYIIGRTKALQVEDGEEITDQMIQEQGFYTLLDLIESARWTPAGIEKDPISIHQTTLNAPDWAASVVKSQSASDPTSPVLNPAQPALARAGWLSRMQSKSGRDDSVPATPLLERDLELSPTTPSLNLPESIATSFKTAPEPTKRPTVQMTHAVVLDFDPSRRSERAERVICHLDRSHNVQAAYHIELAWLTASGKVIDTGIQNWSRQLARYGITLVEVSTRPVLARHNPFQKPRYLSHLLRSLDFFLDLGADHTFPDDLDVVYSYRRTATRQSQFIHRSGAGIASILAQEDGIGFAYVPNRIFTSHHPSIDEDAPLRRLRDLCADADRLAELWSSVPS
ncbi:hypothetical protein JCM10212_000253 [Sporobolomyces blumeae]